MMACSRNNREGAKSAEYAESDHQRLFALSVLFASSR
jgi:hypothetical protein